MSGFVWPYFVILIALGSFISLQVRPQGKAGFLEPQNTAFLLKHCLSLQLFVAVISNGYCAEIETADKVDNDKVYAKELLDLFTESVYRSMIRDRKPADPDWKVKAGQLRLGDTVKLKPAAADRFATTNQGNLVKDAEGLISLDPLLRGGLMQCRVDIGEQPMMSKKNQYYWYNITDLEKVELQGVTLAQNLLEPVGGADANPLKADDDLVKTRGSAFFDYFDSGDADSEEMLDFEEWKAGLAKLAEWSPALRTEESIILRDPEEYKEGAMDNVMKMRSQPVVVQMLQLLTKKSKGKEKDWQKSMLRLMFNAIDTNGNGLITRSEFQKHFTDCHQHAWWVEDGEEELTCAMLDPKKMVGKSSKDVMQLHCKWLVTKNSFGIFIVIMVLFNCCVLGYEHYGMDPDTKSILETLNLMCTIIFVIEMILKVFALTFSGYLEDAFNKFDGFIVFLSLVEMSIPGESAGLSVFRAMRILRIFKVARGLENFQKVLSSVVAVMPELANFAGLVLLFIFFFAVMGLHLFGGTFDVLVTGNEEFEGVMDELPRSHFDSFEWAILSVFQMLTGENWNTLMYDTIKANGLGALIYFLLVIIFGVFMLLNLFLAVLLQKSADAFMPGRSLREDILHRSGNTPPPKLLYEQPDEFEMKGVSLFLFKPDSSIRVALKGIVSNPSFEGLILFCIIISSLSLAVEEPDQKESILNVLDTMDLIFTIIFTFEMLAKITVLGLVFGSPHAYFKSAWNGLDGTIVVAAWGSRMLKSVIGDISFVKGFRVLRALRPLRVIKRIPELKLVVNSLFASVPTLGNVLLLLTMYWMVFGILGLQLFGGKFYACNDGTVVNQTECIGTYLHECGDTPVAPWAAPASQAEFLGECHGAGVTFDGFVLSQRAWEPPLGWGFDDIGQALVTLFEVSTLEMWLDIMYWAIDASGDGLQPVQNSQVAVCIFFVIFIIFGSFFMLELFVGAIVTSYNVLNEQTAGGAFQSARQMAQVAKLALKKKDEEFAPTFEYQVGLYKIMMETPLVENMIGACIVLNIAVMALSTYDMSDGYSNTLDLFNDVFTWIFALECILQNLAQLPARYFQSGWNCYDAFVVVVTVGDFMYTKVAGPDAAEIPGAMVLRVFRIARIIRLLKRMKSLFDLFLTVASALPTLVNIGAILCLSYFIYSVLGMHIFGGVKHGEFLNAHANFDSFPGALLTVFRMSTGESWNGIMHDCAIKTDCSTEKDCAMGTCCGSPISALYFITFQLLGQYIMLNLFIAVMLEYYQRQQDAIDGYVTEEDHEKFEETWAKFVGKRMVWDGHTVQYEVCQLLPVELFDDFMTALPASIGWTLTERRSPTEKRRAMLEPAPLSRLPVRSMQLMKPFLPGTPISSRNLPEKWVEKVRVGEELDEFGNVPAPTAVPNLEGGTLAQIGNGGDKHLHDTSKVGGKVAKPTRKQKKKPPVDNFAPKHEPLTAISEQHYFHFREVWHTLYNRTEESHLRNEDLHPDAFKDDEARKRAVTNHTNIMLQTQAQLLRDVNIDPADDTRLFIKLDEPGDAPIDERVPTIGGRMIFTLEQVNASKMFQRIYRRMVSRKRKLRQMRQTSNVNELFDTLWAEEMEGNPMNSDELFMVMVNDEIKAMTNGEAMANGEVINGEVHEVHVQEYTPWTKKLQRVLMQMLVRIEEANNVPAPDDANFGMPSAIREMFRDDLKKPLDASLPGGDDYEKMPCTSEDLKDATYQYWKIPALRAQLALKNTTTFAVFLARLQSAFADLPSYDGKPAKRDVDPLFGGAIKQVAPVAGDGLKRRGGAGAAGEGGGGGSPMRNAPRASATGGVGADQEASEEEDPVDEEEVHKTHECPTNHALSLDLFRSCSADSFGFGGVFQGGPRREAPCLPGVEQLRRLGPVSASLDRAYKNSFPRAAPMQHLASPRD